MINRGAKNVAIFEDTCQQISESDKLYQGVIHSIENQKLYLQSEMYTIELPRHMFMWRLQVVCVRFQ